MGTVRQTVYVDVSYDDLSDEDKRDFAYEAIKTHGAQHVLELFASLDAARLEKAIQAIRDQSEHDLQMAIE